MIKQKSVEKTFQNGGNVMNLGFIFRQNRLTGKSPNFHILPQETEPV